MKKRLTLTDILVTIVISVVFAIIYKLWGPVSDLVSPLGLHFDELIYGMWFIAATVAFLIIRKPGVALLAETAAASGEYIVGSQYGLEVLLYGVLQGLGAEIIFALFLYRSFSIFTASLAALGATAGSFVMDVLRGYITDLEPWNLVLLVTARSVGAIVIAGVFAYYLVKAIEKTGVTDSLRPVSSQDYKALDEDL
ncbi:ECF transporter S component [Caldalkalibacillus salinus]|uniref:ECF transporter S component n=1 Tax=Caldalkalibacillus salinus TaxID=2803787 RepID=UPI0019248E66|nr:ECF transporter S component [Caldalkalibacillus salinus]